MAVVSKIARDATIAFGFCIFFCVFSSISRQTPGSKTFFRSLCQAESQSTGLRGIDQVIVCFMSSERRGSVECVNYVGH